MKNSTKKTANLLELAVMVLIVAGLGFLGWRFYPQVRSWTQTQTQSVEPNPSRPPRTETPSLRPQPHRTEAGGPAIHDVPSVWADPPQTTILGQ